MNPTRRTLLQTGSAFGLLLAAGLVTSRSVLAATGREGFDAKSMAEALAMLGGTPADSKEISITAPDIAIAPVITLTSPAFDFASRAKFNVAAVEETRPPESAAIKIPLRSPKARTPIYPIKDIAQTKIASSQMRAGFSVSHGSMVRSGKSGNSRKLIVTKMSTARNSIQSSLCKNPCKVDFKASSTTVAVAAAAAKPGSPITERAPKRNAINPAIAPVALKLFSSRASSQ